MYLALLVAVDDGSECGGQISQRIDAIEFARFDQGGDDGTVLSSRIMTRKECVLTIEGNRADGPLDTIVVDLDTTVGKDELQAIPVFGDVSQCLAERGLRCDTASMRYSSPIRLTPSSAIGDDPLRVISTSLRRA